MVPKDGQRHMHSTSSGKLQPDASRPGGVQIFYSTVSNIEPEPERVAYRALWIVIPIFWVSGHLRVHDLGRVHPDMFLKLGSHSRTRGSATHSRETDRSVCKGSAREDEGEERELHDCFF